MRHPPYILIVIIFRAGHCLPCAPIAALWNTRAQRVPGHEFRARYRVTADCAARAGSRRTSSPSASWCAVSALFGGLAIAAFSAPGKLAPVHAVTDGGVGSVAPVSQSEIQPGH